MKKTAWIRRHLWVAGLLIGCLGSGVRATETVDWMYEARVPVEDQSVEARQDAAGEGLITVLSRISGRQNLAEDADLTAELGDAQNLVSRFSYESDWQDGVRQSYLRFRFEPRAVQSLVRSAQLPIWSSRRPHIVSWIARTLEGEEVIIGSTPEDSAQAAIDDQAWLRGLPLTVPAELPPAHLLDDGLSESLLMHAESLSADALLVGSIIETADVVRGHFEFGELSGQGAPEVFSLRGDSVEALLRAAVDRVSGELAVRYAVVGDESGLVRLHVAGINDIQGYAKMMRYLASLEYLSRVSLIMADATGIELALETPAGESRVRELLQADGLLVTEEEIELKEDAELEEAELLTFEPRMIWRG